MKTLDITAIEHVRDACNNFIRSGYLTAEGNIVMNSKDLRRNLMQNMAKRKLYARKLTELHTSTLGDKKRSVKTVVPK